MAGGKETPRQKMIGMMYLVLTALLALNVSKSILDAFVAIEENIQKANQTEYFRGQEKRAELSETAQDKTEPERAKKAAKMLKIVDEIDKITASRIEFIDKLKKQILEETGEDVKAKGPGHIIVTDYSKNDPLKPARMDLDKVNGKDKYDDAMRIMIGPETNIRDPKGEGIKLWQSLNGYRKELTETIAAYKGSDELPAYYFKAPMINKYKDQKDLGDQIDKAIAKSNVAQDDKEAIKKIYASLTKEEFSRVHDQDGVHWIGKTFDHSPSVAAIASLSSLQKDILAARADAVALIRSRVGGGEYSFNKIMALAYGPELANSGDEIELQVLMAAYDSDKQPGVTVSGGSLSEVKEGKGYIKARASSGGDMTIRGTITITNKSGVPKTENWEKTIKIMKPSGTVSLPELNVLYRGYANQVEAVASGYDQTLLSGNGVTLSKSGNRWIANPGGGTTCTITVSGKSSVTNKTVSLGSFPFRISRLPPPELYFGQSPSGESGSKAETRLFAKYPPEIPLNAAFTVINWELSVPGNPMAPPRGSGGQLSPQASALLRQAKPGSIISIMTTVVGPDKVQRKKGGSWKI
jgi:gliding motility-associated protein GldM